MRENIGKCKNMSIPKAALIVFFKRKCKDIDCGQGSLMHDIVDVAGGNHIGMFTPAEVTNRLRNSPYWESKIASGFYKGFRGNAASPALFKPTKKGIEFYKNKLKENR